MISQKQIDEIRDKVIPILKRYGVRKAAIFGSVVRGEATAESDIDILVDVRNDMSLLDFVGLKIEIAEALDKNVDLVEYNTIKPLIKERILSEQVVIL
ncbi:MAG: nucleotidyltransferase family protein [Chloroflexi bacterium]|nr:nucleotidyltransferase family protein [Chloroflexota bacterium]